MRPCLVAPRDGRSFQFFSVLIFPLRACRWLLAARAFARRQPSPVSRGVSGHDDALASDHRAVFGAVPVARRRSVLPAGEYRVDQDEELIDLASRLAWRRVGPFSTCRPSAPTFPPARWCHQPADLDAALEKDHPHHEIVQLRPHQLGAARQFAPISSRWPGGATQGVIRAAGVSRIDVFRITATLPETGGSLQYRIRSEEERTRACHGRGGPRSHRGFRIWHGHPMPEKVRLISCSDPAQARTRINPRIAASPERMAMLVTIEFFRIRETDKAQALVGRETAEVVDLNDAIAMGRRLGLTLHMPQRPVPWRSWIAKASCFTPGPSMPHADRPARNETPRAFPRSFRGVLLRPQNRIASLPDGRTRVGRPGRFR